MTIGSTLRRSAALGRLGLGVAGARLRRPGPGRDAARRRVAARMGRMRGLPQKIGQILSVGAGVTTDSAFAVLTEATPAAGADESFAWIAAELGRPLDQVFRTLDRRGAAASIGQVHRGELLDGRAVAVKVQYPGVAASLDTDLAALGWMATPLTARAASFDLHEYRQTLHAGLTAELDYTREAAALRRFHTRAATLPDVATPAPVDDLCTRRLLTMSWLDGERAAATAAWPAPARHDAALALLRFFLHGCFVWREVHADPHAGNILFRRTPRGGGIGVVDFGCVAAVAPAQAAGLRQLAQHGGDMNERELLAAYAAAGFDAARLAPLAARLPAVTAVLFEPFQRRGGYDVSTWNLSARLAAALGDDRMAFRAAGPASLLFLIRAFQGLVTYTKWLDARLDWRLELLALPPGDGPAAAAAEEEPAMTGRDTALRSTSLRVEVRKNGAMVARLAYAASAVEHLAVLVPTELRAQIARRGICLEAVAARLMMQACPPGDVVQIDEADTQVRVWLD